MRVVSLPTRTSSGHTGGSKGPKQQKKVKRFKRLILTFDPGGNQDVQGYGIDKSDSIRTEQVRLRRCGDFMPAFRCSDSSLQAYFEREERQKYIDVIILEVAKDLASETVEQRKCVETACKSNVGKLYGKWLACKKAHVI